MQCVQINVDGVGVNLSASSALDEPQCLEGSLSPRGGWISPAYGQLEAAPQLLFPVKRNAEVSAFLVARFSGSVDEIRLTQVHKSATGIELQMGCNEFEDQVEVSVDSGEMRTHVRWKRFISGKVIAEEDI